MTWIFILIGLVLLSYGSDKLVDHCIALAKKAHLSELLISLLIIGLGTSLPELSVSINSILKGTDSLVVGNVAGSNIANVMMGAAISIIICPILSHKLNIKKEIIVMLIATLIFFILGFYGTVNRLVALLLITLLGGYFFLSYHQQKKDKDQNEVSENDESKSIFYHLFLTLVFLAAVIFGSDLFVENAIVIAKSYGISEAIIGLSLVAIGTSLPEVAVTVSASLKKNADIVLGNIIGSNIMNILFVLAISALIQPIEITSEFGFDLWVVLLTAIAISVPILLKKKLGRILGIFGFGIYCLYIAFLYGVF